MAREHETSVQPWGTLEELLLACAVNRHGTNSWDSIAMEVQNRTSSAFLLTPENCKHKFDDLKRRFMMSEKEGDTADDEESSSAMVDHLKRIRVDELRREVRRRDVSIVSLELKVKRLEEERERSLKEKEEDDLERLDSQNNKKKNNLGGDDGVTGAGDGETSSENRGVGGGRSKSGDDGSESCDRENRSFNESNSTGQKRSDLQRNGVVSGKSEPGPEPERSKSDRAESERKAKEREEGGGGGNDVARGENSAKQSSEAQSSMSLSRRKRRRVGGGGGRGSSSGEEPEEEVEEAEGDEVSPATKRLSAIKSEPFVKLLGIIRSHRLGSVFQRRLRSQESQRYKNLIRQHMDLQTVEARLEKGLYLDSSGHNFFRDLLLVFNNAVVFFRKGSQEHVAARELRALVLKEMKNSKKFGKSQTLTARREIKREDDLVPPKSHKNNVKKSPVMVTCGKRGSSKTEVSKGKGDKKEKVVVEEEEKPKAIEKKTNGSFVAIDDKGIRKKRSQERVARRGGSRMGNNGGGESERGFGGNELSSHDALEVKTDKRETVKKKQGVASFLKRMKQNSPKQAEEEDVSEEDSDQDSKVDKEEERNRRNKGKLKKSSPVKERVTRSSTQGSKGTKEDSRKAKRGVGRPPKRPEKAVVASNGKRGRDNADQSEVGVVGGRPRKRSRR